MTTLDPSTPQDICPKCMRFADNLTPRGTCQACFLETHLYPMCLECLSKKKKGRNPVCVDCLISKHNFRTYRSGKQRAIGCRTCKRMAPSKPKMRHICFLKEHGQRWTCDLCNQEFSSSSSAVAHLSSCSKSKKQKKKKTIKFNLDVKKTDGPLPEKRCLFFLHRCYNDLGIVRRALLTQASTRLCCPPLKIKSYIKDVIDHIKENGRIVLAKRGKGPIVFFTTDLPWLRMYLRT